jgi:hypothetical protein
MAALHDLISSRERGEIDFFVWPHEGIAPPDGKHLVVECYPALYPSVDKGPCHGDDERDAWKTVQWLAASDTQGKLETYFTLRPRPLGRTDITFEEQVCFEGWIFGVG